MAKSSGLGAISAIHAVDKPADYSVRVHRLLEGLPHDEFYVFIVDVFDRIERANEPAIVDFQAEVTVAEAARLLGVSRPTLYRLIDGGELVTRRLVGTRKQVVPLTEVQRLRDSRKAKDRALVQLDSAVSDGLPY